MDQSGIATCARVTLTELKVPNLLCNAAASRLLLASSPPVSEHQQSAMLSPEQANQQADVLIASLNTTTGKVVATEAGVQILSDAVTAAFGANASAIVRKFE